MIVYDQGGVPGMHERADRKGRYSPNHFGETLRQLPGEEGR